MHGRPSMKKPSWWTDADTSAWERAKEALHRDWDQTKHDLRLGGHELNQNLDHTLAQAVGAEAMPAIDVANPPKVLGRWEDAEIAIGFGYAARSHYGDRYSKWSWKLERRLAKDWKSESMPWKTVRGYVRHGYEVRH
jgi:hypothetical protein